MKKIFMRILSLTLVFICIFQISVFADGISLLNNNTVSHYTEFNISADGKAIIDLEYTGFPNVTTGATITMKIEKRNLLLFWTDIVETTYSVSGSSYSYQHRYVLEKTGTYRCTVEYVISGTGGADDVITFQDTKTYG